MPEKVNYYNDLKVWNKAMDLVVEVYRLQRLLPKTETYVLSDQMRRAAISVPSNIAEGHSSGGTGRYVSFLKIAKASVAELETQILLGERLNYFSEEEISSALALCQETGKMLNALISKLNE